MPEPEHGAVHTGIAYVGSTGPAGAVDDFTALGDVVNTTARLASSAAAGEVLVSLDAATAAGRPIEGLERRTLDVRAAKQRSTSSWFTRSPPDPPSAFRRCQSAPLRMFP